MGFEIDNNNGANCYRSTAVFLPPAFGTLQRLQVNERGTSEVTCDILRTFLIEIFISNS